MYIVCSDLEGVFTPEIWISVAKHTGIDELKLTTRDISDYNVLMRRRLEILRNNNLTLHVIQHVIAHLKPLHGAVEFIAWLRKRTQLVVVSDTFVEFANPLMEKLGHPTLFCNHLTVDHLGNIVNYHLRQENGKMKVVEALQDINYKVIAVGDSYNDINMLRKAETGILYRPPHNVVTDNSDLPVVDSYDELKGLITRLMEKEN
ncbi:MAG: bifunctional phosphoserine phosphatase/homoserine phosphotransferase ThrH [Bacteroidales bacterium]|jgi:phosphoserine/homoserine phosphotransferase|nr:bifunctional phosphoserine phosphatase/homoserine phosphotransferase ThrH [Bacteroidales bacterium]